MTTHTDRGLAQQLELLRARLLKMAGLVESMIADSVRALVQRDVELAQLTMLRDREVNRLELEVDEQCMLILARWQPVASDLRFLTIALKMVTDLERIGDLTVNICERAVDMAIRPEIWPWETLEEMTNATHGMVSQSVDAFVHSDEVLAKEVIRRDDVVDELYAKVFSEIMQIMNQNRSDLTGGIHALSVVKWMERIADHATTLAEFVVFMVDGKDIRHLPRDRDEETFARRAAYKN